MNYFSGINEEALQLLIHEFLSDPSVTRQTASGKRLQILSPGRINHHSGPDFIDIALLINGSIIVGDAEFHRKSSEWVQHNHSGDPAYSSVVLHIVFENNKQLDSEFEHLIILQEDLYNFYKTHQRNEPKIDLRSIEDLQHFALLRLLRKTSESQKLINKSGLKYAYREVLRQFFAKYLSRRKRPVYSADKLASALENIEQSPTMKFLMDLESSKITSILDSIYELLQMRNFGEGSHFRREVILNCMLPVAICIADEENRISLFSWYWSTPALNQYGKLERHFPEIPQNFLWQQQGMLEYMREHGNKKNIVAESIRDYGFGEVLNFYKLARIPVGNYLSENESI